MLKFLGIVYGLFGLTSILTVLMYLRYGPSAETFDDRGSFAIYLGILGICMANALVGALIFYSFWSSKAWGRYLAIGLNVVWLGTVIVGFLAGRMTGEAIPPLTGLDIFSMGVFVLVLLAITIFLLRSDVKKFSDPFE